MVEFPRQQGSNGIYTPLKTMAAGMDILFFRVRPEPTC